MSNECQTILQRLYICPHIKRSRTSPLTVPHISQVYARASPSQSMHQVFKQRNPTYEFLKCPNSISNGRRRCTTHCATISRITISRYRVAVLLGTNICCDQRPTRCPSPWLDTSFDVTARRHCITAVERFAKELGREQEITSRATGAVFKVYIVIQMAATTVSAHLYSIAK